MSPGAGGGWRRIRFAGFSEAFDRTRGSSLAATGSLLLSLVISLVITSIVLLVLGADPVAAFRGMFRGAFGSEAAFSQTLLVTVPLVFAGLAAAVPLSAKIFNIGGEGQIVAGAAGAATVAFALSSLPPVLLVVVAILAGMIAGGLWGMIAGLLKVGFSANEVIVTLMLNFVAIQIADIVIHSGWADPISPQTKPLPEGVMLPLIGIGPGANIGIILAIVAVIAAAILMQRTALGFGILATGFSAGAAKLRGYRIGLITVLVFVIGGAFAGVGGGIEVVGKHQALVTNLSANYGFTGIAVALVARLMPIWVLPSALFFAAITVGASTLPATVQVSTSASFIVLAVFVLTLLGMRIIRVTHPEVR